jgi:hypothetical protein
VLLEIAFSLFCAVQITMYCICTAVTLAAFVLWRRLSKEQRKHLWTLYGYFTFCAFVSCVAGAYLLGLRIAHSSNTIAWLDQMSRVAAMNISRQRESSPEELQALADYSNMRATDAAYYAWITIPEGLELCAISWAKLAVLDRITHAAVSTARGLPNRWLIAKRATACIVAVLMLTALCSRIAVKVLFHQVTDGYSAAANQFLANNRENALAIFPKSSLKAIATAHGVYGACDATCLIVIVTAFLIVAGLCGGRIKRILMLPSSSTGTAASNHSSNNDIKAVMRQVMVTSVVVFCSLLSMALVTTVYRPYRSHLNRFSVLF